MSELKTLLNYIEQRQKSIENYSDKLEKALTSLRAYLWRKVDRVFVDSEPFRVTEEYKYYLLLGPSGLAVRRVDEYGYVEELLPCELQRETLKELYKSGRLVAFLKSVAEQLVNEERELADLIRIAEAIEAAIPHPQKA
jgi:hypothetical protein